MLLRWSLGEPEAADAIEAAVDAAIDAGPRTADLGGSESTAAVANFLLDCIGVAERVPA
jgi:3-isopropylmalate dehydrogenase